MPVFILIPLLVGSLGLHTYGKVPDVKVLASGFIYEEAPFPECHASTLVETERGILAAWFGGTYERHEDVSIYTSLLSGSGWSTPEMVADGVVDGELRYPCWNPVLFHTPNELVLFYKVGPSPQEWWGVYKNSPDGGKTWSAEVGIPDKLLGPIKNKPELLQDGSILYPTSIETEEGWDIYVEHSDPGLDHWEKTPIDNADFNAIQPTILFQPDNRIEMLCRTREGKVGVTWSADLGRSWTPVEAIELANNNSGIDAVTLASGYHLLVCNPQVKGRNKLSLMGSSDGLEWEELLVLEDQPEGEFSYPAIIQAESGHVFITYTYNRLKIKYMEISI